MRPGTSPFMPSRWRMVDLDFAKEQLELMLREFYLHPNGQIPAYEWNFGDVNPPVHAWATMFLYRMEQALHGQGDIEFLKRSFGKLLLNFTWWVNRKDRFGKNVFEGGFLGSTISASSTAARRCPPAAISNRPTAPPGWRSSARTCSISRSRLAAHDPSYEDMAMKFVEHFLWIASGDESRRADDGMWDEEDGFYYDVLRLPDGRATRLKVRSMVGLLPLCATTVIEPWQRIGYPRLVAHFTERVRRMPELLRAVSTRRARNTGGTATAALRGRQSRAAAPDP